MTTPSAGWDSAYEGDPAPWDIGRPQPAFVRLAEAGLLSGRLLDAGCGTGEHVLLAAAHGADAMGVDLSGLAIEKARAKAAERGLAARFEAAEARGAAKRPRPFPPAREVARIRPKKPGRNDLCVCGSMRKWKQCCGAVLAE